MIFKNEQLGAIFRLSLNCDASCALRTTPCSKLRFFSRATLLQRLVQETDRINIANARDAGTSPNDEFKRRRSGAQSKLSPPILAVMNPARPTEFAFVLISYFSTAILASFWKISGVLLKTQVAGDDAFHATTLDIIDLTVYRKPSRRKFTIFGGFSHFE